MLIASSISNADTSHMDAQSVLASVEQLLSLNGWVAAMCPTLTRPFSQNKHDTYDDLVQQHHLYYFAIVIHSADHFLVDQLAVIVQMARRLGSSSIFVSMLDYDSTDSTETLVDLCEAVLTLLGVPFRIRKVPRMTEDPAAAYYPLEEAHMRNLALEPLKELHLKRKIKFDRVIWLKGFTCPNDILENIKISLTNEAAMVCGMDWAEYSGFFIFSDRYPYPSSLATHALTPSLVGGHVTSTETSSGSLNPRPNKMQPPLEMLSGHRVTRNIYHSRFFVANREHTSLILRSHITEVSITVQGRTTKTSLQLRAFQTDPPMPLVWIVAKRGSVVTFGSTKPGRVLGKSRQWIVGSLRTDGTLITFPILHPSPSPIGIATTHAGNTRRIWMPMWAPTLMQCQIRTTDSPWSQPDDYQSQILSSGQLASSSIPDV
jgi:hypothetical protein